MSIYNKLHANANLITGLICGYRIEELQNPLTQKVRYLDNLVDELAKGKKMEKILRTSKKQVLRNKKIASHTIKSTLIEFSVTANF